MVHPSLTNKETTEDKFSKIKPLYNPNEAVIEASRCLFCHDAPCITACPTSIDIPMFIRQIMTKNTKGAAKTIFTQNILGKSCGDVCPTSVLCEGACVYHHLNEKPIEIGRLQAYATNDAIENNIKFFEKGETTNKKVAVIGGGPAGLACAHELTVLGHAVTVFDANEKAGGLNTYGVAPYKFSNKDSEKEVKYISNIGFEIKTSTKVITEGKSTDNKVLLSDLEKNYDAIFIGTGLGKTKSTGITGENLKGVYGATEFIYDLRKKEQRIDPGKSVVIIGGGNTGIDAAVESALLGAEVTMVYRRSENELNAYDFEVQHAREKGVKFLFLSSPVEIVGKDKVEGIKFIKNTIERTKSNTKSKPEIKPVTGTEFIINCDRVIIATGQEKQVNFLNGIQNLKLEAGKIVINKDFQTSNAKYFAGGDCINGGKEVVNAAADGRDAARGIHKFLMKGK